MIDQLIDLLYTALFLLILGRIILSFVNVNPYHPVPQAIFRLTEPLLAPIRRLLPPAGGFDFSPMLLLFLAYFVKEVLKSLV